MKQIVIIMCSSQEHGAELVRSRTRENLLSHIVKVKVHFMAKPHLRVKISSCAFISLLHALLHPPTSFRYSGPTHERATKMFLELFSRRNLRTSGMIPVLGKSNQKGFCGSNHCGGTTQPRLSTSFTNIRSIFPKRTELCSYLQDSNSDILMLTETWLHPDIRDDEILLIPAILLLIRMTDLTKGVVG